MKSRSPDFILKALRRNTDVKGRVGCGWANPDGSVSIALDPFVVLSHSPDLVLNLFPAEYHLKGKRRVAVQKKAKGPDGTESPVAVQPDQPERHPPTAGGGE